MKEVFSFSLKWFLPQGYLLQKSLLKNFIFSLHVTEMIFSSRGEKKLCLQVTFLQRWNLVMTDICICYTVINILATCLVKSLINLYGTVNQKYRSSRPEVFCEKGVLRNFAKFTGKHLWQSLFLNKVAGLRHRYWKTSFFLYMQLR